MDLARTVVVVVVGLGLVAGDLACVERGLVVRSDPPGARIFLDGAPRGETPAAIPFTYYGTREVVLRAPGRKTKRVVVHLDAPWYELMPIDFFAEVLWPGTIRDEHVVEVVLEPAPPAGDADLEALETRAEAQRRGGTK